MSSSGSSPHESEWSSESDTSALYSEDEDEALLEEDDDERRSESGGDASCQGRVTTPGSPDASRSTRRREKALRPLSRGVGDTVGLRGHPHHSKRPSISGTSVVGSQSAHVYAEALRSVRQSPHRASISIASGAGAIAAHISEDTRKRHRESKNRLECADLTQHLLFRAHDLQERVEDMPLWLHASVIPPRWRVQIMEHLRPILEQMEFCRERVLPAWRLLLPPFDRANLHEYEQRLKPFERSIALLEAAIGECERYVRDGEQQSACLFLQIWYRRHLAKRGFYTKTLKISRHHRGLIPGMFDTIPGKSKLTVQRRTHRASLEYPTSPAAAKHAFS